MAIVEPLNLQSILVNHLAGNADIFFFLSVIFLGFLAARLRIPNVIFMILILLFTVILAGFGYTLMYTLAILVTGVSVYWIFAKVIKS